MASFPNHHPDPTVEENLEDLKKQVAKEGAVCGIASMEMPIALVSWTHSRMVYGDELMVLFHERF